MGKAKKATATKKKNGKPAPKHSNGAGTNGKLASKGERTERSRFVQELPCRIEDAAVAAKADQMAAAYRRREATLDERRTAMAGFFE